MNVKGLFINKHNYKLFHIKMNRILYQKQSPFASDKHTLRKKKYKSKPTEFFKTNQRHFLLFNPVAFN